ncbi:hypothetical protein SGM_3998 [Streptomyces griseoaurantiacus M045]|uniref:Uncharacterized protein n=1 Tax=Streptomyces griseoaurantiacus M045 TaxID=996637 RepID=F3NLI4_9ACTN|nr:hypothetical protein SGM_3998 [Streptomyces griseoaurantiacus M045]
MTRSSATLSGTARRGPACGTCGPTVDAVTRVPKDLTSR